MTSRPRSGYTLTELLVVTALMASLMGLVIAHHKPSQGTRGDIRRGAQHLASILLDCQSHSLGSPNGFAVVIDSVGSHGEVLTHARRYPYIEGTVTMPPANPAATQIAITLTPRNDDLEALTHGYMIRFRDRLADALGPPTAWFALSCNSSGNALARLRTENGQTPLNTLWPAPGSLDFQAARYPIPTGPTQSLPTGVVIDLRYSGYGDISMAGWGSLANRGAIAIGFDTVGSVDTLMQNVLTTSATSRTIQPFSPEEEVYFLVTLEGDVLRPDINALANKDAIWVVVHPKTGRVSISPNVPQVANDAAALRSARSKAREGVPLGG